jgi:dCTP deaminase
MIFSDKTIKHLALTESMIDPFYATSVNRNEDGTKVTSFGLTSYGYDIRLGRNFMFFRGEENKMINYVRNGEMQTTLIPSRERAVIDPNEFDENLIVQIDDVDQIYIPPKTFFMGVSHEYIRVPKNVKVTCDSKSTCARSGIAFFVTPLEPEWEGYITLEFFNCNDAYLKLTPGMGISQLEFKQGDTFCEQTYASRGGKYNFQGNQPIPPLQKKDPV